MLDVVAVQQGQLDGAADTVVGAQRGALGLQPLTVHIGLDGIVLEIDLHIDELVADHVHVALQDDAGLVLHARRGGLADDDVASLIDLGLQAALLTECFQVLDHLLLVLGRTGNCVDFANCSKTRAGFNSTFAII